MERNMKVALGIGAAAVLGWLLFFRKGTAGKAATPDATVRFSILPAGYSGEYGAIPTLAEGTTGNQAVVTVKNNSVYTGTTIKAPFTFNVAINIQVPDGTTSTWGGNLGTLALAADATGTYTFTFSIPYGTPNTGPGKGYAFLANPAVPLTAIASATPVAVTVTPAGTPGMVTFKLSNIPAGAEQWLILTDVETTSTYFPASQPILKPVPPNQTFDVIMLLAGYPYAPGSIQSMRIRLLSPLSLGQVYSLGWWGDPSGLGGLLLDSAGNTVGVLAT